jgi:hypothetical protein
VPLVETSSNTTGGTIEAAEATELPVNGRDFTKLLELVPGATSDPVGSTESAGSYGLFSLNGNRGRSNNYLLDGTDMNDGYRNLPSINQAGVWGCPSTILPVDALAEIPVTGSPEAEFGRSCGRNGQHCDQERLQPDSRQRLRVFPQCFAGRAQLLQHHGPAQELIHQPSVRWPQWTAPS